jgi:hypothetical protein
MPRVASSSPAIGTIGAIAGWCADMWALPIDVSAMMDLRIKNASLPVERESTEEQKMVSIKRRLRERKDTAIVEKTLAERTFFL